jgi:hypothetical protein
MSEKRTFIPLNFRPSVKGEKLEEQAVEKSITYNLHEENKTQAIVCLNVKDDQSQSRILQKIKDIPLIFLSYDELGYSWNYSFYKGNLIFYLNDTQILPVGIYCRPYLPDASHPKFYLFNNFMRALDAWPGKFIGPRFGHFQNSSKAYQLTTTIKQAIKHLQEDTITFPESYFVKGIEKYSYLLKSHPSLIVKSCSGIRSKVSTGEYFREWDAKPINSLPTFFQKACFGPDIRIHCFGNHFWSVIVKEKEGSIDYRYASKRGQFEKFSANDILKKFCKQCSEIEETPLSGLDFIQVGQKYICLESNPSPGWAGFHRFSKEEPLIAQTLVERLWHG